MPTNISKDGLIIFSPNDLEIIFTYNPRAIATGALKITAPIETKVDPNIKERAPNP